MTAKHILNTLVWNEILLMDNVLFIIWMNSSVLFIKVAVTYKLQFWNSAFVQTINTLPSFNALSTVFMSAHCPGVGIYGPAVDKLSD